MTADGGPRGRLGSLTLFLVVFGALVLRIAFAIDYAHSSPLADRPVIDEAAYERWALEIAEGDWIGDEVFFQEPLYPYWLGSVYAVWGLTGDDDETIERRRRTAARHIQAFFGAFAVLLIVLVANRLFGGAAAVVAGIGAASCRTLAYFPSLLLKPNLFLPALALLVWILLRARVERGEHRPLRWLVPWLGAGVVAALGALLRGNLLLLLPAIAALPLIRAWRAGLGPRCGLAPCAALVIGMLLVLLPVATRNQIVGGVFALTTSGAGTNFYGGNNAQNPYGRATEFDWVRGIPEHEADDWKHEAERRTGRMLDAGEVSSFWLGEALASMRSDPGLHLSILWNKLRLTLGAYEVPDNHHVEWDARHVSALRLPLPGFGLWGMLGIAGLIAFAARRWGGPEAEDARGGWELLTLFVLYLGTIVLTVTSMRIRLALLPMLLPFAGYWVHAAVRALRAPAGLPACVVSFFAATAIVHLPVLDTEEIRDDLLKRDFNLAVYQLDEGDLDAAEETIGVLREEHAGTVSVMLLESQLDYRRGFLLNTGPESLKEVEVFYDRALSRLRSIVESEKVNARDRFRAQKLAGYIVFDIENWPAAERRFREALVFDPDDWEVRLRLANVLFIQAARLEGQEKLAALHEAKAILEGMLREEASEELERRLREVEAELP